MRTIRFASAIVLIVASCGGDDAGPGPGSPGSDAGSDVSADGTVDGQLDGGGPDQVLDGPAGPSVEPWVVFESAGASTPMSGNKLQNGSLDAQSGTALESWAPYGSGYGVGPGRTGNAIKLVRAAGDTAEYGASQSIALNQPTARAVYFAGWSKAEGLTGDPDSSASIYLDISYKTKEEDPQNGCEKTAEEPCSLYGQIPLPRFDAGTHDWQHRDGFAVPAYPIKSVSYYVLLRGDHQGTLWFDDLELKEVDAGILSFDGQVVSTTKPSDYTAGEPLQIATGDGVTLSLWSGGGAPGKLAVDGKELLRSEYDYASGFILHDPDAARWIAPGGSLAQSGNQIVQSSVVSELALDLKATYSAESDRLRVRFEVSSSSEQDRALTVYHALAVKADGWEWGDDIRRRRALGGAKELSNTGAFWGGKLGATGELSRYPFGTLFDATSGLTIGYPLDQPRNARIVANPVTGQLFIAFDLGLSPATTKFPNRASAELVLYRTKHTRADDGFRSALQGFQQRFPAHFERRIPAEREGIWVAFADLSKMVHGPGESIDDFHIGIHEVGGVSQVEFDDQHGIQTFRYVIEPASTWLKIEDQAVDPNDYDQVVAHLQSLLASGTESQKELAQKTLNSAVWGPDGKMVYEAFTDGPPWCAGKCALFYLSPDPSIDPAPYAFNQATSHWNDAAKQAYTAHPGLDGEYLDSYVMNATLGDYRPSHLAAADTPLTFTYDKPRRPVVPLIHATEEFATWLRPQLPDGKYLIANALLIGLPWGAQQFDFMGQEVDWLKESGGTFSMVPEEDWLLSYRRSMSGQRPYGFLLNTNFQNLTSEMAERYMKVCLFYGIYPSFFSENASEGNYFENEALYDRDRALFKKYIPLIKAMSAAGWQPMTSVYSPNPDIVVERWGTWPDTLRLTVRNIGASAATATLELDRAALGIADSIQVASELQGTNPQTVADSLTVTLPAGEVELLKLGK